MAQARPRVMHVVGRVLERSETFIQRRLIGQDYENQVLTWGMIPGGLEAPCPVRVVRPGDEPWTKWVPRVASLARHASALGILGLYNPEVVHAHFAPVGYSVLRECVLLRKRLITTFYGFDVGVLGENTHIVRALYEAGGVATAEGPSMAARLVELGWPEERVKLLPQCLPDWALDTPERTVEWRSPELRLLQVARFVDKKGIDTTLRAVAKARQQGVNAKLVLVGDGSLKEELQALARELAVGDSVEWPGFRPYSELPKLLAGTHVFMQPSRTAANGDTEGGHPATLIEALAQGVPVVGTTHADIPFAVTHGETGLLYPENDADGVASGLVELNRSRDRLVEMSGHARRRALEKHDPRALRILRESIYRELKAS
jgi:colanic acid/amylovoran biosynthesis glycosyltransferase